MASFRKCQPPLLNASHFHKTRQPSLASNTTRSLSTSQFIPDDQFQCKGEKSMALSANGQYHKAQGSVLKLITLTCFSPCLAILALTRLSDSSLWTTRSKEQDTDCLCMASLSSDLRCAIRQQQSASQSKLQVQRSNGELRISRSSKKSEEKGDIKWQTEYRMAGATVQGMSYNERSSSARNEH